MATAKDTGGQRQAPRRTEEEQDSAPQGTEDVKERQDQLTDDGHGVLDALDEGHAENDEGSAIGISGVAGTGIELARLFQVELEHYEKLEGHALSLDGKANRLASMVRGNIGAALQGLGVGPLFCGYDEDAGFGRIFSYDVAGGRYEEHRFYAIGSGSVFARGSLKKLYRDGMSADDTALACMQALYDAADDDSATGGPDVSRRIYPVVATITADGYERLTDEQAGAYAQTVIEGRLTDPDGPPAPLQQAGTPKGGGNAQPPG